MSLNPGSPQSGEEFETNPEMILAEIISRTKRYIELNLVMATKSEKEKKKFDRKVDDLIQLALKYREEGKVEDLEVGELPSEERKELAELSDQQIRRHYIRHDDSPEEYEQKMVTAGKILASVSELALLRVPREEYTRIIELFSTLSEIKGKRYVVGRNDIEQAQNALVEGIDETSKANLLLAWMNSALEVKERTIIPPKREEYPELFSAIDALIEEFGDEFGVKARNLYNYLKLSSEVTEMKWRPFDPTSENPEADLEGPDIEGYIGFVVEYMGELSSADLMTGDFDIELLIEILTSSGLSQEDISGIDWDMFISEVAKVSGNMVVERDGKKVILPTE